MSNNSIKVTLKMSPTNVLVARRNLQKGGKVQKYVDSEVIKCSDPYIPMLSGKLKESHHPATIVGSGLVTYDTPYAKRQYYLNRGNGEQGTNKGGLRGRLWFERMKKDHLPHILKGVKRIAGAK